MDQLVIGSRNTPLALAEVKDLPHQIEYKHLKYAHSAKVWEALRNQQIDVSVSSSKDPAPNDISTLATSKSPDNTNALVAPCTFENLPKNSIIGVASQRIQEAVLSTRSDITIQIIRGDILHRLNLVETGILSGLIVASIALKRLHKEDHIREILPPNIAPPHPMQGQLTVRALKTRDQNKRIKKLLKQLEENEKWKISPYS